MKIKTTSSGHGTSISPKASRKLKNLGFLCSLLVVAYHVEWPKDVPFSFGWFIYQGIADGVARMAVPFFFVVSGFFLARHFGEKGWWLRETRKRARSLLLPFFLWSLLALLVSILSPVIDGMLSKHLAETSFHFPRPVDWPRIFGLDFSRYPLNYPLWYLRGLFVLVLLSPALGYLVATVRLPCLATAFCLLLFCWRLPVGHWHVFLFHAATGLFYFSVGIALDKVRPAISFRTASFAAVAGLALLAAKMVSASVKWHFQYELAALSLPCFLVAAWTFGPESEWPAFLTTCAFPIFLMHIPVIWIVNSLLRHAALGTLATAFAQLAVGIICPCAFSCLLHRHAPKVASVLFGGR